MIGPIILPERCMRCEQSAVVILAQYQHGQKYKCGPASDVFQNDGMGNFKRPLAEQDNTRFIRFDSYCADHYMAQADSEREWREANPLEYLAQTRRYGAGHHA